MFALPEQRFRFRLVVWSEIESWSSPRNINCKNIIKTFFIYLLLWKKSDWIMRIEGKGQNYKNQNVKSQKEHQKFEKDQNVESFH